VVTVPSAESVGCALIVLGLALALLGAVPLLHRAQAREFVLARASLGCVTGLLGAAVVLAAAGTLILYITSGRVVR
jgi:hypothetical protein